MRVQKLAQRLHQLAFGIAQRNGGGQTVEAHHIAQHAPKAGVEQVAALAEHGIERGTTPLQVAVVAACGHLH